MHDLVSTLRHALRSLSKSPRFALGVVGVLALGLGVNAAVFTLVDAALFRPLPFPEPDRLVRVFGTDDSRTSFNSVSYPYFEALRDGSETLSGLAAFAGDVALDLATGEEAPQRLSGSLVTGNYFELLGAKPAHGRLLRPEDDDAAGAHPVAVLSHAFWSRGFGADPGVIGREVRINRHPFTVVGVAPEGFVGASLDGAPDLWMPTSMVGQAMPSLAPLRPLEGRNLSWVDTIGRLAPGATAEGAEGELRAVAVRFMAEDPAADRNPTVTVLPAADALFRPDDLPGVRRLAYLLGGVVLLLFVLAAAVATSLLVVRTERRRRDVAVHLSLGAGRGRLARTLVAEGAILAAGAAAAGLALATGARRGLLAVLPSDFPIGAAVASPVGDPRVVAFVAGSALAAAAILVGVPLLRLRRLDLAAPLRGAASAGSGGPRWMALRNGLVVLQVAVSVVVLIGSGLLLRTLWQAARVDPGFATENALVASLDFSRAGYELETGHRFQERLIERLEAVPGVVAASVSSAVPVQRSGMRSSVEPAGYGPAPGEDTTVHFNPVSPGYFRALGVPIVRGRGFAASDRGKGPEVAVVNRAFAERFFPGRDPVGLTIENFGDAGIRVVGVAADYKVYSLRDPVEPALFIPSAQFPLPGGKVLLRTRGPAEAAVPLLLDAVRTLDPELPVFQVETLEEHVGVTLAQERALASLLGAFGALTVLLSLLGLYSVLAFATETRTREFGIRMAVGADRRRVAAMVLRQGLTLAAVGLALGVVASAAAARALEAFLFGVTPEDPWTFAAVAVLTLAAGAAGALAPARSATRVDPIETLRSE